MSTENTGADVDQNADAASLTPAYTQTPNTVAIERYTQPSYGYGYGAPDDGKIHVMELLRVIRKWKWLIVSLVVVVTTIASIEIYRTPSTYRASAILEIGRDDLEALKTNNLIIQNEDPISVSMKTDTIKLTSPPLLQEVVEKLNLDQNPKFLAVNDRKSFWSALKSLVSGASGQEQEHAQPAVFTSTSSDRKPSDNRSPQQSERLAPYVSVLQNNLEVEPIKDSRMMKVSFVHTDPGVAADVANGIAQDFIDFSFQTKTARYTKASEWLDRSTRELKARVEQAEKGLADYTREHNIFSLEGKETLTTDKLSRLHDQETRAETDRILKQSLYEEAKGGKLVDIPEAFSDQKIAELSKTLSELETKQAEMRVTYGPKNPEMVEVTQQIDSIKQQIEEGRVTLVEKLRADYERAVRDEQALKGALTTAKGQAVQENQDAIQFNILKQEVETSKSLYTEFLQKTNQANLDVAEQNSNLRLISPAAAPKAPISPDRPLTIFVALSLSLTTGILLAFFLEYLDNSIKSVDDINRYI
ncbi:MAG TPA: GumC family protein, partial [Blastocatellia bacterium]